MQGNYFNYIVSKLITFGKTYFMSRDIKLKSILKRFESLHDEIGKQLTDEDVENIKVRLQSQLKTSTNYLQTLVSGGTVGEERTKREPLRKLFGKSISEYSARTARPTLEKTAEIAEVSTSSAPVVSKTPEEIQLEKEAEELQKSLDELYPKFNEIDTAGILDTYSEIEIRLVAKRAGLPVTETTPEKVDAKFVEQVKKAIIRKAELEKTAETGKAK
jgi:hypothetical protein